MSTVKTRIDPQVAQGFLDRRFPHEASHLERIEGGELAEAFFFEAGGKPYVVRVDSRSRGFAKDAHAYRRFSSPRVPIPEIVQQGRFDQRHSFAISRRAQEPLRTGCRSPIVWRQCFLAFHYPQPAYEEQQERLRAMFT